MKDSDILLKEGGSLLIVDDQEENLDLLEEILLAGGYTLEKARDGIEALEAVERRQPDCIVLDVMMPRLDGFGACRQLKSRRKTCFIPIIILTALSDVTDKIRALEVGADDFLNKPVHPEELLARVRSLVRIKHFRDELDTSETIITTMVKALEMKDPRSAGHSGRVAEYAVALSHALHLSASEVEIIGQAALLHDLGKIGLPEAILWTNRKLGRAERNMFERHPELGSQILAPLTSMALEREIILHHHERLDGSGYPSGLKGDEITLHMEVVALVNAWDDIVQNHSWDEAKQWVEESGKKGLFHETLTRVFLDEVIANSGENASSFTSLDALLPVPEDSPTGRILLADDTPSNREVIREILEMAGHTVVSMENGESLLDNLSGVDPDLILVDIRMGGMDGFEVCKRIKAENRTHPLPVILITAHREMSDRARGVKVGADDFLLLPINRLELTARVKSLLRLRFYLRDLEEHQSVILSLASVLEAKDPYTQGHSERVGTLSARLAEEAGLPPETCDLLRVAGKLHDIGKIAISETLLNKPGKLTDEEFSIIKSHPVQGEEICQKLQTVRRTLPIIRHHHERFDGTGYPDHLKGEAIPLEARILGLVDAYDAMTSARPYRQPLTPWHALAILEGEMDAGKWDPALYRILVAMVTKEMGGTRLTGDIS